MSNARSQMIISLSPDSLCAATTRKGKVVQAERLEMNPKDWDTLWEDGLMTLDQPLRQLISRFPTRKIASTTLIYHSPTLTQQVHQFEMGLSAARDAAVTKIRNSIGLNDPIETCLYTKSGKGETVTVLVYSEREEHLRSLYAWLNRCHIDVKSIVPDNVAAMNMAVDMATQADPDTAVFYLGSDVAVMAYATETGLKLLRSADIGYRKLVDSYTQILELMDSYRSVGEDGMSKPDSMVMSNRAIELLFEHGIPVSEIEIDGVELRSAVIPTLAPVLQRFCIEIKQTFRFGLHGTKMPKYLMFSGPGSAIPYIGKSITQQIDMHVKVDPSVDGFTPLVAFARGSLELALVKANAFPNGLLPEIAHEAMTRKLLTRGLVAGVILSAAVMVGEYAFSAFEQKSIEQSMIDEAARLQTVIVFQEKIIHANTMSNTISDVSELVCDTIESLPQWQGMLASFSRVTPDSIRLQELDGEVTQDGPVIEISGVAVGESERNAGKVLNEFISEIKAVEGVIEVSLGATSRIRVGEDQWGRQFVMKVLLEKTPMMHQALVHSQESFGFGATQ